MAYDNTVAARVRARKDPAIAQPPPVPMGTRTDTVRNLHLQARGRIYPIGDNIDGATAWTMTMDGAATVTVPVRSPDDSLLAVLTDEALLQDEGVRIDINGVTYVLSSVGADEDNIYNLSFEDEAAWRLRQFSRFLSASRKTTTRALFIQRMVDEASGVRPKGPDLPYEPIRSFIPELGDKQRILAPKK